MDNQEITARFPSLAGKHAIVTGTSQGIGVGIAGFLGRQGMRLTLAARSRDRGEAVAETLRQEGIDCRFTAADLTEPAGAERVLAAATEAYGAVEVLVNNAAILKSESFLELDEASYAASLEGNIRTFFLLSQRVARQMVEGGVRGSIIMISSVGGLRAHRDLCGYDAAKGAMDAMTRAMAVDLAPYGIRVNGVAPGAIWSRKPGIPATPDGDRRHVSGIPLQRLGTPEEIGAAVAFLASDAARYITGQTLYVDGGLTTQLTPPGIRI